MRALTSELGAALSVTSVMCPGFWKPAPFPDQTSRIRIINNTLECFGPWLVCYENDPPAGLEWAELPSEWVCDGRVELRVGKGTLIPRFKPRRKRKAPPASEPRPADGSSSGSDVQRGASCSEGHSASPSAGASCSEGHSASPSARASASAQELLPTTPGSFVTCYVDTHRHLCQIIEQALAADPPGAPLLNDEARAGLLQQLETSRALLAAASGGHLAHWRSLDAELNMEEGEGARGAKEEEEEEAHGAKEEEEEGEGARGAESDAGATMLERRRWSCDDRSDDQAWMPSGAGLDIARQRRPQSMARLARGPASGLRVLTIASGLDLPRPSLEARVCHAVLSSAGAQSVLCDARPLFERRTHAEMPLTVRHTQVGELDGQLFGVHVLLFCGHADMPSGREGVGGRTLAFSRGGVAEAIDPAALTQIVAAHRNSLQLVVLNGCHSLHLGMRFAQAGISAVACWGSAVPDEAAQSLGIGLCTALAHGAGVAEAFEGALAAVRGVTESATPLSADQHSPKFVLVDPVESSADESTGRIPLGKPNGGRVAAGVPWLLRWLPADALQGVPSTPVPYQPRIELESAVMAAVVAHLNRSRLDDDDRIGEAGSPTEEGGEGNLQCRQPPTHAAPTVLVLVGGKGHGKSALAAWTAHELRTQSACPDGVLWMAAPGQGENSSTSQGEHGSEGVGGSAHLDFVSRSDGCHSDKRDGSVPHTPNHDGLTYHDGGGRDGSVPHSFPATPSHHAKHGQRRLVVLDNVTTLPLLECRSSEQLVLITTRLPRVAASIVTSFSHVHMIEVPPRASHVDAGSELSPLASLQEVPSLAAPPTFPAAAATMADADPEAGRSTVWYSILVQSLFVVPTVAYLLMEKETEAASSAAAADAAASPSLSTTGHAPIGARWTFWPLAITVLPYASLLLASPAHNPLVRALVELTAICWAVMLGVNFVAARNFASRQAVYPGAAGELVPAYLPVAFHAMHMVIFASLEIGCILPLMRARHDAPPFFASVRTGVAAFKATHGPLAGRLLSLPGTFLPTCTFSYYLPPHYFQVPTPVVVSRLWATLHVLYTMNCLVFSAYYALIYAMTQGQLAQEFFWIPACAATNFVIVWACKLEIRQRIRAVFFPQHQDQLQAIGQEIALRSAEGGDQVRV